jgi:excisionase family DNA binding protein
MKKQYSVPEVAEILGVHPTTLRRWIHAGKVKAFNFPAVHNKIPHEELVALLKSRGISTDRIEQIGKKRVLLIDDNEELLEPMKEAIERWCDFEVKAAVDKIHGGFLLKKFKPHLVLLDNVNDDVDEKAFCTMIREDPELRNAKIVKYTGGHMTEKQAQKQGYDGVILKSEDFEDIVDRICSMITRRKTCRKD